jgi:hypothetical protein
MLKRNLVLIAVAALATVGCGKSYQGSYTGVETLSYSQQGGTGGYAGGYGYGYNQAPTVTIQIDDSGSDSIRGTYTSAQSGTFTFQGIRNGDNIEISVMYQTAQAQPQQPTPAYSPSPYGYPSGGYNGGYAGGYTYGATGCMYTGTLQLRDNNLQGTLTPTQTGNTYGASMCPSRTVMANRAQ